MILHDFMEAHKLTVSQAARILSCSSGQIRRYRAYERGLKISSARKPNPACLAIIELINRDNSLLEKSGRDKRRMTNSEFREIMSRLGLTSYSLSSESGISKSTVCNWMNGEFEPSFQVSNYLKLRAIIAGSTK